ncbi:response regulator [uncultured Desulfobacter sp.]|uniref:hybrid sensor histidine kinase/response regulator n=1 Tax=uncultured Desulfobacter sp. TaxID=240139 RepID=UPI002AA6CF1C|nr:response regulator [uncultured Desulfobacter sp.]
MNKIQKHILLVEDNPADAELIRVILSEKKPSSYMLHVKERLSEALDFLSGHKIDIVLLDLGLPDSHGVSTIQKIKEQYPFIPIVVITGNENENTGIEAVRMGAQDYICKGLIPNHYLTQTIEYAIHRQDSEFRLRQSEAKYKSIVDNIGIGVALINVDLTILETNSCMHQWFPQINIQNGTKCYESIQCFCNGAPDFQDCPVTATLKDGMAHTYTGKKDHITYQLLSSPLKDGSGQVKGVVLLSEDISERLSVEARLRQAQKMESLGTLAGGVAHDFNNILTAIHGFAALAKSEAEDNDSLKNDLSEILNATHRAGDLVKQILTFSRMGTCEKLAIRMDLIIKEVLKLLRSTLPSNIEIINLVGKTQEKIIADPTQIHQIMMNLCTNAFHAMEETGGTLKVSLEQISQEEIKANDLKSLKDRPHFKLMVKDTGTGIPTELMESIFDPYFTTKGIGEGTGLGLSVVQGIVKDCDGKIVVESTVGKGSCFTLYFPITKTDSAAASTSVQMEQWKGTENILLVDDEPSILKLGTRILSMGGYQVHTEVNGHAALEYIQKHHDRIDLILSDMAMPKMTGFELAQRLLELPFNIPIIIMTGYSHVLSTARIKEAKIKAVIAKPLFMENLMPAIRKALDKKSVPL